MRDGRPELGTARDFERHTLVGKRSLGADDALGDGRFGDEERPRDFVGRQTAEQAQRQRDARLDRQHRMARRKDEPQQIVADIVGAVVDCRLEVRSGSCSASSS